MEGDYLLFNSRDEMLRIRLQNIVYFESNGNYTYMVTINKLRPAVHMNLSNIEKMIEGKLQEKRGSFMRVGRKYIINRNYLYMISPAKQRLVLSDQSTFAYQLNVPKEALSKMKNLLAEIIKNK